MNGITEEKREKSVLTRLAASVPTLYYWDAVYQYNFENIKLFSVQMLRYIDTGFCCVSTK